MSDADMITLFHSPQTRSAGALTLLEELGAPYKLHVLNMKAGEQQRPAYLAVNPLGKVPAILHRGTLVTEQVAIFIYLADLFPKTGLAPSIGDADRGPYLRWLVYYAASYEPALVDKAMKREPGAHAMSPYGTFDTMLATIVGQIRDKPYLLGDRISAADILWGSALNWGVMFKLVPEERAITRLRRTYHRAAGCREGRGHGCRAGRAASSGRRVRQKAGPSTRPSITTGEKLERAKGFEPSTPTLARLCSTPELHPHPCISARERRSRALLMPQGPRECKQRAQQRARQISRGGRGAPAQRIVRVEAIGERLEAHVARVDEQQPADQALRRTARARG